MSDEKRQTRLLPFRVRRLGAARRATAAGAEDLTADAELTALLGAWEAPPQSEAARARLLADFRATVPRAPIWRRALAAELRVPLPVAACAALALLLASFALGARTRTGDAAVATQPAPQAVTEPVVRVLEVPVVQERVVTRTVYVEKKERAGARGVSTSRRESGGDLAAAGADARARDGERQGRQQRPAAPGAPAGYFTNVDMEDFQPADEVKIRIVKRGSSDER